MEVVSYIFYFIKYYIKFCVRNNEKFNITHLQ